jgi:hypothetical protein
MPFSGELMHWKEGEERKTAEDMKSENKKAVANATAFDVFGAQERTRTSTMLLAST